MRLSFVVAGRPVSLQARRREVLRDWKETVRRAAPPMPSGAVSIPVVVWIVCFLEADFQIDVDNVAKPILDAIKDGAVLADDALVVDLTLRKRTLGATLTVENPPVEVAAALDAGDPFVHIEVEAASAPNLLRYGSP